MQYDIYAIVSDSAVHKYGNWTLTASAFRRYGGKGVMPDRNDAENHDKRGSASLGTAGSQGERPGTKEDERLEGEIVKEKPTIGRHLECQSESVPSHECDRAQGVAARKKG